MKNRLDFHLSVRFICYALLQHFNNQSISFKYYFETLETSDTEENREIISNSLENFIDLNENQSCVVLNDKCQRLILTIVNEYKKREIYEIASDRLISKCLSVLFFNEGTREYYFSIVREVMLNFPYNNTILIRDFQNIENSNLKITSTYSQLNHSFSKFSDRYNAAQFLPFYRNPSEWEFLTPCLMKEAASSFTVLFQNVNARLIMPGFNCIERFLNFCQTKNSDILDRIALTLANGGIKKCYDNVCMAFALQDLKTLDLIAISYCELKLPEKHSAFLYEFYVDHDHVNSDCAGFFMIDLVNRLREIENCESLFLRIPKEIVDYIEKIQLLGNELFDFEYENTETDKKLLQIKSMDISELEQYALNASPLSPQTNIDTQDYFIYLSKNGVIFKNVDDFQSKEPDFIYNDNMLTDNGVQLIHPGIMNILPSIDFFIDQNNTKESIFSLLNGGVFTDKDKNHFVLGLETCIYKTLVAVAYYHTVDNNIFNLESIMVAPSEQKNGYGSLLLFMIINHAVHLGYEKIIVDSSEEGIDLYLKFGFEPNHFYDDNNPKKRISEKEKWFELLPKAKREYMNQYFEKKSGLENNNCYCFTLNLNNSRFKSLLDDIEPALNNKAEQNKKRKYDQSFLLHDEARKKAQKVEEIQRVQKIEETQRTQEDDGSRLSPQFC